MQHIYLLARDFIFEQMGMLAFFGFDCAEVSDS